MGAFFYFNLDPGDVVKKRPLKKKVDESFGFLVFSPSALGRVPICELLVQRG